MEKLVKKERNSSKINHSVDEPVVSLLPAERVGGVGDDRVVGEWLEVLHVERRHGAGDVVRQVEAAVAAAAVVHLDVVARRVTPVEPGLAAHEELLRKSSDNESL